MSNCPIKKPLINEEFSDKEASPFDTLFTLKILRHRRFRMRRYAIISEHLEQDLKELEMIVYLKLLKDYHFE